MKWELRGQTKAEELLNRSLAGGLSHAYLFSGPPGVGKATAALAFVREILHFSSTHPDFLWMKRQGASVKISEIRELQEWMSYKPFQGDRRAVIIEDAHLMTLEAANALLKTLEEPPGQGVIILLADKDSLLPTVQSRCQVIRFYPVLVPEIRAFLLEKGLEEHLAGQLAIICEGSPGRALTMSGLDVEGIFVRVTGLLQALARGESFAAFEAAEYLEKNPEEREPFLVVAEALLRAILRNSAADPADDLDFLANKADLLREMPAARVIESARIIEAARGSLGRNANILVLMVHTFLRLAGQLAPLSA